MRATNAASLCNTLCHRCLLFKDAGGLVPKCTDTDNLASLLVGAGVDVIRMSAELIVPRSGTEMIQGLKHALGAFESQRLVVAKDILSVPMDNNHGRTGRFGKVTVVFNPVVVIDRLASLWGPNIIAHILLKVGCQAQHHEAKTQNDNRDNVRLWILGGVVTGDQNGFEHGLGERLESSCPFLRKSFERRLLVVVSLFRHCCGQLKMLVWVLLLLDLLYFPWKVGFVRREEILWSDLFLIG